MFTTAFDRDIAQQQAAAGNEVKQSAEAVALQKFCASLESATNYCQSLPTDQELLAMPFATARFTKRADVPFSVVEESPSALYEYHMHVKRFLDPESDYAMHVVNENLIKISFVTNQEGPIIEIFRADPRKEPILNGTLFMAFEGNFFKKEPKAWIGYPKNEKVGPQSELCILFEKGDAYIAAAEKHPVIKAKGPAVS